MPFELKPSFVEVLLDSQSSLDQLIPNLLDIVLELTGAERGFLMLYGEKHQLVI